MSKLARFLSVLALVAAALAISVTHFAFPPVGFEGMVFLSSVAVFLALASAALALILVIILLVKKDAPKPVFAAVLALTAVASACGYLYTI